MQRKANDSDLGIVESVIDTIERKVSANNIVKAKSGKTIVVVSLAEIGLTRCDHNISTVVCGIGQLRNCKVLDSRTDGDAFMFNVKI